MELQLDPKAAAERIRMKILSRPEISAEMRHISDFAKKVCEHLGIELDGANVIAVIKALQEERIKPHQAVEYPKMLTDDKGKPVLNEHDVPIVFNDAEEEANYTGPRNPVEAEKPADPPKAPLDDPHETTAQRDERLADEEATNKRKKKS